MLYKSPKLLHILKYLLLFFGLNLLTLCKSVPENNNHTSNLVEKTPEIVFLTYQIIKDTNGKKSIEFINSKTANGKLKSHGNTDTVSKGDLYCYQLGKNQDTLSKQIIRDPLLKRLEVLNEKKSFQTRLIALNRTQFTIRLQLDPSSTLIGICDVERKSNLITTKTNKL